MAGGGGGAPSLLSLGPEKRERELEDVVWFNHSQGQKRPRKKMDEKCFANVWRKMILIC